MSPKRLKALHSMSLDPTDVFSAVRGTPNEQATDNRG
jgi:hypothetical protein